jgi:uncharacterized membrane protein
MSSQYQNTPGQTDPKTVAIISYLTIIGWLIAYFAMYNNNRSSLAGYHLRQTLFLYIIGFAFSALYRMFWGMMFWGSGLISLGLFILWLLGFISAVNGQEKPMPLIGDAAQRMFHNL